MPYAFATQRSPREHDVATMELPPPAPPVRSAGPPAPAERRFVGSLRAVKSTVETVALLSGVVALVFVSRSLHQDELTNRVAARQAIASQYREIEAREFERPDLYLQLFSGNFELGAAGLLEDSLHAAAPSLRISVAKPGELDDLLWHSADPTLLSDGDRRALRALFLHAQSYLNFLDEVVKSQRNGVISRSEADTWLNILEYEEFYCHPVVLYALWDAAEHSLYSAALAHRVQEQLVGMEHCPDVVDAYYPELTSPSWVSRFLPTSG